MSADTTGEPEVGAPPPERSGRVAAAHATTGPAPHPGGAPERAAFFDVDNTIVRGASAFYLGAALYRRRFFRFRDIARFFLVQARFKWIGEKVEHVHLARGRALALMAGHSVAEVAAIGQQVYDEVLAAKVWPGTRAMLQRHLDAGERVWLVTATPMEVADVMASRLGITGALGTVAASRDGVYTGELVGELLHGDAKAEAIRALAAREGLDLARCSAYSDSSNDLPMLTAVGNPVAVNPDRALRAHARAAGWPVHEFRSRRHASRPGVRAAGGAGALWALTVVVRSVVRRLTGPR